MKEFVEGYVLKENEYLLKIREDNIKKVGFLTKFNQNGTIPKAFLEWGPYKYSYGRTDNEELKIYVFEETFNAGWKLNGYRFGKSQNWVEMKHPEGFIVEIYMTSFLEILKTNILSNGIFLGFFKWENNTLIKQEE